MEKSQSLQQLISNNTVKKKAAVSKSESEIQNEIVQYLRTIDGMFCFRHSPIKIIGKGQIVKVGILELGIADIICCYKGQYIELEVKTSKGQQSIEQKAHEKLINKCNGEYYVVTSVEDVKERIMK